MNARVFILTCVAVASTTSCKTTGSRQRDISATNSLETSDSSAPVYFEDVKSVLGEAIYGGDETEFWVLSGVTLANYQDVTKRKMPYPEIRHASEFQGPITQQQWTTFCESALNSNAAAIAQKTSRVWEIVQNANATVVLFTSTDDDVGFIVDGFLIIDPSGKALMLYRQGSP